jgi:hypothetical protein
MHNIKLNLSSTNPKFSYTTEALAQSVLLDSKYLIKSQQHFPALTL